MEMTQIDLKQIKAIAFDFGGTLDIPGTHWFDFFWNQFEGVFGNHPAVTKDQYWNAYVFGERRMEQYGIPRNTSFRDTIVQKLTYQFEYITTAGDVEANESNRQEFIRMFTVNGMADIEENLKRAAQIIRELSRSFDLSIVSNYYGNLKTILSDAGIFPYVNRLLDSTIVGIRKPDPEIWKMALAQSGCKAEEFLIVGDSMKNDILPAQSIGCPTVLITTKNPPEEYTGKVVNSLEALAVFFQIDLCP